MSGGVSKDSVRQWQELPTMYHSVQRATVPDEVPQDGAGLPKCLRAASLRLEMQSAAELPETEVQDALRGAPKLPERKLRSELAKSSRWSDGGGGIPSTRVPHVNAFGSWC